MSKTVSQALKGVNIRAGAPTQGDPQATVKGLFMMFHGWYGNLFTSRYATGEQGTDGRDRGTKSAMVIWQNALDRFEGETVRAAADRCEVEHPKFPPTLPEFLAICKAAQPRKVYNGPSKIEMSEGLKASNSARARDEAMAKYHANRAAETIKVQPQEGLPLLQQLVAEAVGLAGGDEVATLRRFDAERRGA